MTRDDFTTLWRMLTGLWPKLDTPETVAAWYGLLAHYPAHHATSAVRKWATERRTAPTPADVIDGIKAIASEQRRNTPRAIDGARCDECDSTGFVWLDFDGQGTVRRCARGCMPPTERREEHEIAAREPEAWILRFHETRVRTAARRRDLGESEYLRERGYDPARHRIVDGTIVVRPR